MRGRKTALINSKGAPWGTHASKPLLPPGTWRSAYGAAVRPWGGPEQRRNPGVERSSSDPPRQRRGKVSNRTSGKSADGARPADGFFRSRKTWAQGTAISCRRAPPHARSSRRRYIGAPVAARVRDGPPCRPKLGRSCAAALAWSTSPDRKRTLICRRRQNSRRS